MDHLCTSLVDSAYDRMVFDRGGRGASYPDLPPNDHYAWTLSRISASALAQTFLILSDFIDEAA